MDLPTRLVGLQHPHRVYELNSTLFLLYCLFSGSFYNPRYPFDVDIQKSSQPKTAILQQ
jgi:hypothetical protein